MIAYQIVKQMRRRLAREYYGIVVDVDTDSTKCKVQAVGVLQGTPEELPWASIQASSGTVGRGQVWSPRVGDKVFVAFPTGDANHPVVQPGYNTRPDRFPTPASQHGWQDLRGNYLLVDEGASTFTLHLATGAEIRVGADNAMTIKAKDVSVLAERDVVLEAGRDVKITASGNVATTATGEVSTEAVGIKSTAANIDEKVSGVKSTDAASIISNAAANHTITAGLLSLN